MGELEIGLCWGTVHRAGLVEMIELAARHGFPTLSVPPHIYFAATDAGHSDRALRRRLADAGVRVRVVDAITAGLPGKPGNAVEFAGTVIPPSDAATCLTVAQALEAPLINVSHFGGEPVPLPVMAEAIGAACRQAGAQGMGIVLEFVPGTGIASLGEAHAIAQASGEPNCAVLLDVWHLARTGGTAADIAALPPGAVGAFQLCDRTELPPGAPYVPMTGRALPGEGEQPLGAIVAAVRANNPAVTAELEVFSEELAALPLDAAAARAAAAVAAWREAAGIR